MRSLRRVSAASTSQAARFSASRQVVKRLSLVFALAGNVYSLWFRTSSLLSYYCHRRATAVLPSKEKLSSLQDIIGKVRAARRQNTTLHIQFEMAQKAHG